MSRANRLNEGIRVSVACTYRNIGVHTIRAQVKITVRGIIIWFKCFCFANETNGEVK